MTTKGSAEIFTVLGSGWNFEHSVYFSVSNGSEIAHDLALKAVDGAHISIEKSEHRLGEFTGDPDFHQDTRQLQRDESTRTPLLTLKLPPGLSVTELFGIRRLKMIFQLDHMDDRFMAAGVHMV